MSEARALELIDWLGLESDDFVLDAGCGRAAFLMEVLRASGSMGFGVDIDAAALAIAEQDGADLIQAGHLTLSKADLQSGISEDKAFQASVCLGSTHAFEEGEAAFPSALTQLSQSTRFDGRILIGECFWKTVPSAEYLTILGEPVGIYRSHDENLACVEQIGLRVLKSSVSTDREWDRFERDHLRRAEMKVQETLTDEPARASLEGHQEWYSAYEQWGRSTLGFGFYLIDKS